MPKNYGYTPFMITVYKRGVTLKKVTPVIFRLFLNRFFPNSDFLLCLPVSEIESRFLKAVVGDWRIKRVSGRRAEPAAPDRPLAHLEYRNDRKCYPNHDDPICRI